MVVWAGAAQAGGFPEGWRQATPADVDKVAARIGAGPADRAPDQKLSVTADFDGDGKPDRASVVIHEARGRIGVFVTRGAGGAAIKLSESELDQLPDTGLLILPPGSYETACGKGAGSASTPCRPKVVAKRPSLGVVDFEASEEIFIWNGKRFVGDFLSD